MPTTTSWLTPDRAADWRDTDHATARAGDVAREIADDAVSLTLIRAGVEQTAQTVRLLMPKTQPRDLDSVGGHEGRIALVVLGESDFDVQRGDRFSVSSQWYEVVYVDPHPASSGERVEAWCVQVQ